MWQIRAGFVSQREHATNPRTDEHALDDHPTLSTKRGERSSKATANQREESDSRKRKRTAEPPGARATKTSNTTTRAAANIEGDGPTIPRNHNEVENGKPNETVTRSGRKAKPAPRLIKAMAAEITEATSHDVEGEIHCYVAMFPDDDRVNWDDPLLAYKATSDPDTLYYHQATKEQDKEEFENSMLKEVEDQYNNGNFSIVHKSEVPDDQTVLPAVWQMRRKRDAKTGAIKKFKARLNIDGSRMRKGVHYDMKYSPVASWNSVRMLLTLTALHGWHTKQINFVQAFAQAPIEKTLYMKIPAGITFECDDDPRDYVLKIHRNIYGQKQAGRVWNQYLVSKLVVKKCGFKQSNVDKCVFYRGKTLYVLYTDDSLLAGSDKDEIDQIIWELQEKAKLTITVEGDLADFLGVNIDRRKDGIIHLTQPHLIDQILKDLRLDGDKVEHGEAVRWLGRYLKGTRGKGTIMKPIPDRELEVYVDASFCGDWDPTEAANDRDTARSRHGYIINYAGCPLQWKSQLQTEIALSSTESEYTGLSQLCLAGRNSDYAAPERDESSGVPN
ncbi:hypothetical protein MHU86_18061 [Fragilaria crotonensis]|nr:hypothetical protein MHU86_18061 [Fragilaria crotonensis]